jgi:alanine-synthesizing transaminase
MQLSSTVITPANRVRSFTYAIRNIVAEAAKLEATGRRIRYLNVGDPVSFGFRTPEHVVEAVTRALIAGRNAYAPSVGVREAREAVAADLGKQGWAVDPDRVMVTTGTSEGIELALTALLDPGDEVLVPLPSYPLYTAILAKLEARALHYRTDSRADWRPDLDHLGSLVTSRTKALVVIDPNNPTGAVYPRETREALLALAERAGIVVLADEVYADLAYESARVPLGALDPASAVISFNSLSKGYLAPGWRTGWLAAGSTPRLNDLLAGIRKLADGRLCSPGPMQYAIAPALVGDRSFQQAFRLALITRAEVTARRLNAIPGMSCVPPRAAFYAMPQVRLPAGRSDEDFVLALLKETGVLCVHGSGFGMAPGDGFFRIVFLSDPGELDAIYTLIDDFTRHYQAL